MTTIESKFEKLLDKKKTEKLTLDIMKEFKRASKEINLELDHEDAARLVLLYTAGFYEGMTSKSAIDVLSASSSLK